MYNSYLPDGMLLYAGCLNFIIHILFGLGLWLTKRHECLIITLATLVSRIGEDTMGKKGDETKRLILEKAMALFAKKGFKNVTMKDICIDTGLSRGGLYRHYESTNQIFSEIIDILMNTQDNELSSKIENEVPAPVILDEILERYNKEMLDGSGSLSIAILEFYSENQSSGNDNVLFEQYLYSKDMWSYFISYGVNRGEFNNVNSEEIIDLIIFSYQGVRMFSTIMPIDEQIPNRIINHIKKALLI